MKEKASEASILHEEALIRAFFLPDRQQRYLEILAKPKRRRDITREFDHFKHLDPRRIVCIPPHKQHAADIFRILKEKGAPETCYGFSDWPEVDGKVLPLLDALEKVVGVGMGTFLSCIPGRLAFFEGEQMKTRCILEFPSQRR